MLPPSIKIFYIFIIALQYVVLFTSSVSWYVYRNKAPVNARRLFFPITLQIVIFIDLYITILKVFVWPGNQVVATLNFLVFPVLLEIFLWRLFELYFRWKLTEAKLELIKSYNEETKPATNWFVNHSKWVNPSFLTKTFVIFAIIQYAVLLGILLGAIGNEAIASYPTYVFMLLAIGYIVCISVLVIRLRKFNDGYYIKKEYIGEHMLFFHGW